MILTLLKCAFVSSLEFLLSSPLRFVLAFSQTLTSILQVSSLPFAIHFWMLATAGKINMPPGSRRNEWNGIHCIPLLSCMELHWIKHFKFLLDLASIKNAMKPVSLTFLLDVFMRFMPDSWESCAEALLTILSTNSHLYSLWNRNEKTKNGRSINKMINITRIYHIQRPTNIIRTLPERNWKP